MRYRCILRTYLRIRRLESKVCNCWWFLS